MDRATLSYRDEPDIEVERDGGAEDEATCFHARDLRDSPCSERRGKRVGGPDEKRPIREEPEDVRMAVDPPEPLNEHLREVHRVPILARIWSGPAFRNEP